MATETSSGSWAAMALSRLGFVPGAGASSTRAREPLAGAATSTRSIPCRSMSHRRSRLMPSEASGISRNGMMWSERWACMPSLPPEVTEKLARVRHPRPVPASYVVSAPAPLPATASTVSPPGSCPTPASRWSCSARTAAFRLRWRSREIWPNSAPPTGGCPWPQARRESAACQKCSTRSGDASRTSTTSARQNLADSPASVSRTRTFSPGMACRTKITLPSCRATQWPPWATGPTSSTSSWASLAAADWCWDWVWELIGYPAGSLLLRMISAATEHWPPSRQVRSAAGS